MADRDLGWRGTYNARDLGGLALRGGGVTRWGAIVRSDSMQGLEARGWEEVEAHGIRTVIDLRSEHEIGADVAPRPGSIETVNIPLDVTEDREFWDVWESGPQFATPLYYRPHLERFPRRSAAAIRAIATAAPGGVAFHCQGGRDRAGQISMLVLALAGVEPAAIAADYARSDERLRRLYLARGDEDEAPKIAAFLREQGTSATALIVDLLADLDVEATLLAAGLTAADVAALRRRLLEPQPT
ncbi:MAG TPA: tyrosine-protein phosphatase [Solirubrobacterales bacterium]|nr:tyrosine-protein phosphatase [Solirubrobacterales bacterium]